jgi:acetyl-CoA hydrolase
LDVVIVEATAITEDGGIIPGASVGASPELIQMADKVRRIYLFQAAITDRIL